jgi:hypothetical protein
MTGMGFRTNAAIIAAAFASVTCASAQQPPEPQPRPPVSSAQARYAQALHLAYVRTPSSAMNEESRLGVSALAAFLNEKTSMTPAGVAAVDIENDDISVFPFIYWQISSSTPPLTGKAQAKVQAYLQAGGMIVFDVRSPSAAIDESKILRDILGRVRLRQIVRMPDDHRLVQNFYKLPGLAGSHSNGSVKIEAPDSGSGAAGHDNASSIIVGTRNWAAAWAALSVSRDSAEHLAALRAGVNMVTYALTGAHKPTIKSTPEKQPR